jgi:hypothetical protein
MFESGTPSIDDALRGPPSPDAFAAWAGRLRALPAPTRAELLARADALWRPGTDACSRVADVYRALEADLDPRDPAGCLRIRRLLDEGGVMRLERLMIETERHAVDPEVGVTASLVLGQWDLVRNDLERCERRYLDAIAVGRGRWPAVVGAAYNNYARLCLQVRRDLEALVLARRGSEACAAVHDTLGAVYGRLVEGFVLAGLQDWPRLRDVCAWLRRELDGLSPTPRVSIEYGLHELLAELAIGELRPADAFAHVERAAELARAHREPAWCPREVEVTSAQAWAVMGRRDQALECVARGLADGPSDDAQGLLLQALRVRLLAEAGDPATAEAAAAFLHDMASPGGLALGPGVRLMRAQLAADPLAVGWPDEAARAYHIAATAAVHRLAEVARFTRDIPDVSRPTPLESRVLDDYRRRTERQERGLRAALSRYLMDEVREGRWPLERFGAVGDHVCCCAWCGAVRGSDRRWAPLPESLRTLPSDTVPLTHGACPDCLPALRDALREI